MRAVRERNPEERTRRVIYAALWANLLIAVAKFVAGVITKSSAMLAESAHSAADTFNEVFLLIGLSLSKTKPDDIHPYGYGKDRFFWSFLAAVFIFFAGSLFSIYKGVAAMIQPIGHGSFLPNYIVLAVSFIFESLALAFSMREFSHAARAKKHSLWEHFRVSRNITIKVPLYEDIAALAGLLTVTLALLLVQVTGHGIFDAIASIVIGFLLLYVAWELGTDARALLLGEAISQEDQERIQQIMTSFSEVEGVLRMLTMHLGPHDVLVNAEIHLADGLETHEIEGLVERITQAIRREIPEVKHTFIELSRVRRPPTPPVSGESTKMER